MTQRNNKEFKYDVNKKNSYIAWFDEDGKKVSGWFKIINLHPQSVTFETGKGEHKNLITIPMSRVIKIKTKRVPNEQSTEIY